jgi:hypothetical protein
MKLKLKKRPHGSLGSEFWFTSIRIPLKAAQGMEVRAKAAGTSVTDAVNQVVEHFVETTKAPRGIKPEKTAKRSKHARPAVKKIKIKAKTAKKARTKAAKAASKGKKMTAKKMTTKKKKIEPTAEKIAVHAAEKNKEADAKRAAKNAKDRERRAAQKAAKTAVAAASAANGVQPTQPEETEAPL